MAEYSLKDFFSSALVRRLAADVARVHPAFPSNRFVRHACTGLGDLELLDRGKHISHALGANLPASYPEAIDVLLRSLGPEHQSDELVGAGMAPFFYMPHLVFIAERGLDHFELSMQAQHELTRTRSGRSPSFASGRKTRTRTFAVSCPRARVCACPGPPV
jgi:3-methyladenine DNA glycosylase AlkC